MPQTMFDKIWDSHAVVPETADAPAVLYVDLHLIHEVTSPQAFDELRARGLTVRRPDLTLATMDHSTPTLGSNGALPILDAAAAAQLEALRRNCREFGIELFDLGSDSRGIVHVIGPELGVTVPGKTIVCGDSHTSTHGAFGALAFGIGTTEVGYVLAAQCLLQRRPRTMAVNVSGRLQPGVTAKDLILAIIRRIGVGGGTGHVIEYRGEAIRALSMDERMTVCNMTIEAGARAGMVAPDETTFEFLRGRPRAPQGRAWDASVARWRELASDGDAEFDIEVDVEAVAVQPMVTFGTNPAMSGPVDGFVPAPDGEHVTAAALEYMDLEPGRALSDIPIDIVFLGSCTNSRLSDLRQAASVLRGRRIDRRVRMLVVPGSEQVKRAAEEEGLASALVEAGAEWREPGCSMCIAMNGDMAGRGQYVLSTSNRNFQGRQGAGVRTLLGSPLTAAASALAGRVTDPREFILAGEGVTA